MGNRPRALVLVMGWWGARPRQLSKYEDLYQALGCSTVVFAPNPYVILTHSPTLLEQSALNAMQSAVSQHRKECLECPIVIRAMSNGSAFLLERMEAIIAREKQHNQSAPGSKSQSSHDSVPSYFARHVRAQIFDSAPIHVDKRIHVIAAEGAFSQSHPFVRQLVGAMVSSSYHFPRSWTYINKESNYERFWKNMVHSSFCKRQAFVFSTADSAMNVKAIEDLIRFRKSKTNEKTHVLKLEESTHVQHLKQYPESYKEFISTFLDDALHLPSPKY